MRAFRSILLVLTMLVAAFMATARPHPAVPTAFATSTRIDLRHAADLTVDAIGAHRVALIGELHGTQETPLLVAELADRYVARSRPVVLALEVSTQEQSRFDRYLASRGADADRAALLEGAHWREAHHDGRDSKAMLDLIEHARQLRARGAGIALVAFDGGGTDMNARNQRMAQVLRATAKRDPRSILLVLTGNVHAMTRKPAWVMVSDGKRIAPPVTAGQALVDLDPMSIDVRGASGAFWACTRERCDVRAIASTEAPRPTQPRLERNAADDAWDATLLLPHLTPSSPAIGRGAARPTSDVRAPRP